MQKMSSRSLGVNTYQVKAYPQIISDSHSLRYSIAIILTPGTLFNKPFHYQYGIKRANVIYSTWQHILELTPAVNINIVFRKEIKIDRLIDNWYLCETQTIKLNCLNYNDVFFKINCKKTFLNSNIKTKSKTSKYIELKEMLSVIPAFCHGKKLKEAAWFSGQSCGFECGRPGLKSKTRTTE